VQVFECGQPGLWRESQVGSSSEVEWPLCSIGRSAREELIEMRSAEWSGFRITQRDAARHYG
jgi:hypothetical protein